ncbi:TPM domain-containing protein [Fodinibius halophilus]|uniref:TPM domain-containing protein n=1 Tax=Fodinibius halophilus TaxID=1736908 RepID=A0A6M1TNT4_9BACT|nr:TPM domain-containing protein [Fodinibius halophilus]NGP89990.1 TPM domain-containing protein [Fodinibius halophilus]
MFSLNRSRLLQSLIIPLFLFLLLSPALLSAQDLPSEPTGHVSDFANMIDRSEQQQLETKLRNYRDTTTTVIAIATLQSLNNLSIEETATTLFNTWKMWEGQKDNGVLIVIAREERKMRIEVGYGLEGAITDVMAGRIIRNILTPDFKRGNYYGGLDRATSALIQLASGEYTGQLTEKSSDKNDTISFIIFALFIFFVFYSAGRKGGGKGKGKRRRTLGPAGFIFLGGGGGFGGGSSGGGGFGGFSGGGGFGSGGGGASGGW